MKYLNALYDQRVNCYSVMVEMPISEFLELVDSSYKDRGGIEGQRSALKTKTALIIRKRMVEDVRKGTVLPAIVLGIHDSEKQLSEMSESAFSNFINNISPMSISIIDGMQRTTALKEAKVSLEDNFRG